MPHPLPDTDLILNAGGSVYHLNMRPADLAGTVIVVGDPGRVSSVSAHFDRVEQGASNREFHHITGYFRGKRITVLSTGIGTDNIDIVMHELDILANYDLQKRMRRPEHRRLDIIRIGTSGAIRPEIPLNSTALTAVAAGFDNLIFFYQGYAGITDLEMERQFIVATDWDPLVPAPYFVPVNPDLLKVFGAGTVQGITATAPGFYGPQGRFLSVPGADPDLISKLSGFEMNGLRFINFEMESSALYALGALMGHRTITLCALIANRATGAFNPNHNPVIDDLTRLTLEKISEMPEV